MKIAIVDDEKYFVDDLTMMINTWNTKGLELEIYPFYSGEEFLAHYRTKRIEFGIVFMDITLGGLDGIEVVRQLRAWGYQNEVVFTTSHQEFKYAQESLRVGALNYYAKPIRLEDVDTCMDALMQSKTFVYSFNSKQYSVPLKEILYFESKRNYVKLTLTNPESQLPMYKSNMSTLSSQLPKTFIRCHRSYIVNMLHVVALEDKQLVVRGHKDITLQIGDMYLDDIVSYLTKL